MNLNVTQKVARPSPIPVPSLVSSTLALTKGATIGPYTIYSGSVDINSTVGTKYGVISGAFADSFKDPASLGATCSVLGTTPPSTTSSTVVSTSSTSIKTTSSAPTSTPTLAHKPTVGAYTFQGCYTEGVGVRALSPGAFFNYTAMTLELCASDCTGFNYFGVEYGGECKCPSHYLNFLTD